jgi:hypothetical protein
VTVSNPRPTAVRWLGRYVDSGSLALQVRDSSCKMVAAGPPPTPSTDDGVTGWNTLLPAATVSFAFRGWVLTDVAPGPYEVRFAGIPGDPVNGGLTSAWTPFDVLTRAN